MSLLTKILMFYDVMIAPSLHQVIGHRYRSYTYCRTDNDILIRERCDYCHCGHTRVVKLEEEPLTKTRTPNK